MKNVEGSYVYLKYTGIVVSLFIFSVFFSYGCKDPSPLTPEEQKSQVASLTKTTPKKVIYRAKYNIKAGVSLVKCKGDGVTIELYDDMQTLEIKGFTNCGLAGKLDVSEFMNKESLDEMDEKYKDAEYAGIILRAQNPKKVNGSVPEGGAYFTPPRPNIINPLARKKILKPYVGKTIEESTRVQLTKDGKSISDSGIIKVNIHSIDGKAEIDDTPAPLKKDGRVIVYTISTSGFSKTPQKGGYMLFDSLKFWMGTDPVAIYKMSISSKLKDMVSEEELVDQVNTKLSNNPLIQGLKDGGFVNELIQSFGNWLSSQNTTGGVIGGTFINFGAKLLGRALQENSIKSMTKSTLNKTLTIEATMKEYESL